MLSSVMVRRRMVGESILASPVGSMVLQSSVLHLDEYEEQMFYV
jgi:hypothetical protein